MTTQPGIRRSTKLSFDDALLRVREALATEGFGVLTEIDVRNTLAEKLGVEFRRYKILGACNPPFAHEALSIDLAAGLMMPCNVVVFEGDDGHANVWAVDPTVTSAALGNPKLNEMATAIAAKLSRVLAKLG